MPKPWEMTIEQARAEGERLRERRRAADREDVAFFIRQMAEVDRCSDPDCGCHFDGHGSDADEQLIDTAVRNIERQLEVYAEPDANTEDSQNQ